MKVLIVDDHPLFLVGLRHIFTAASHDIELLEATNFADALELIIQDQDIDWLCLDLQIPGGNGIGFIERLRNRGITLPVAILTAALII
ncbi:MAG: response regulator [Pseudomonadota bacterium]